MIEVIDLIYRFQAVFGAVLGAAATLIVTQVLRNIGKLHFYICEYELVFMGEEKGEDGSMFTSEVEVEDIRKARYLTYTLALQIYNSSESMKIIKDITLDFLTVDNTLSITPEDQDSSHVISEHFFVRDKLPFINLPAKTIMQLNLFGYINKEDYPEVNNFNDLKKVKFSYKTYKNKAKHELIWRKDT